MTDSEAGEDTLDIMNGTLEAIGEAEIDPVPLYFERFFARFPEQDEQFHNRSSSEGMMFNEMLELLLGMAADKKWIPVLACSHVRTHDDHCDIGSEQYRGSLELMLEVLKEAAGDAWDERQQAAWRTEIERLMECIEPHC